MRTIKTSDLIHGLRWTAHSIQISGVAMGEGWLDVANRSCDCPGCVNAGDPPMISLLNIHRSLLPKANESRFTHPVLCDQLDVYDFGRWGIKIYFTDEGAYDCRGNPIDPMIESETLYEVARRAGVDPINSGLLLPEPCNFCRHSPRRAGSLECLDCEPKGPAKGFASIWVAEDDNRPPVHDPAIPRRVYICKMCLPPCMKVMDDRPDLVEPGPLDCPTGEDPVWVEEIGEKNVVVVKHEENDE